MIIKPILEKVKDHLEANYSVNTFLQSGSRLAYVVYEAYVTFDEPYKSSAEIMKKAYEISGDNSTYMAFERSVYRELKEISEMQGESFYLLKVIYDIAEGVKI